MGGVFQRASIDEAYLDITTYCQTQLRNRSRIPDSDNSSNNNNTPANTNVIGGPLALASDRYADQLLVCSANAVSRVRQAVLNEVRLPLCMHVPPTTWLVFQYQHASIISVSASDSTIGTSKSMLRTHPWPCLVLYRSISRSQRVSATTVCWRKLRLRGTSPISKRSFR